MNKKKTITFYTLGCRTNQYDTELIAANLPESEFRRLPAFERSDICFINTCSVTAVSERKASTLINKLARIMPETLIIVGGCSAERRPEFYAGKKKVGLVLGTSERFRLAHHISSYSGHILVKTGSAGKGGGEFGDINYFGGKSRANVKIQDGCSQFCSYCIIPYLRGKERSEDPERIVRQFGILEKKGFKEAVITGIHTGRYRGLPGGLKSLVKKIIDSTIEIRIRLSSLEPLEIDDGLLKVASKSGGRICPHFHVPMQSGSDKVLRIMNRPYKSDRFIQSIKRIRDFLPEACIGTDIICGFPGETEDDFFKTKELVKTAEFSYGHVFPFSPRPGTPAADMDDSVEESLKSRRCGDVRALFRELKEKYFKKQVGRKLRVLTEQKQPSGGYSENYCKVELKSPVPQNSLCDAVITSFDKNTLKGEII
ncbi:MAG: tRNA (N(6)-L-threonylcarbamoyladenosine(37)-C(2))-methylthiotransferase MtaB [Fibrobacterota bacterium]